MAQWIKTNFPGVRYRKHDSRKHGLQFDRYFTIRYKLRGVDREEGLGWASAGYSAEKAYGHLKKLRESIKAGQGPQTLKESRDIERDRRDHEETANITFNDYFKKTYLPIAKSSRKSTKNEHDDIHFRLWISPIIGTKILREITSFDIERIKKKMLDIGKSPRTVQYVLATFRQAWNMARRSGFVTAESPTRSVKLPKFDNKRQGFFSHEEADLLLVKLKEKNETVSRMALLSLHTGMRASEILSLTWGCVDTDRGIIAILDTKSGKSRTAFMTDQLRSMFLGMKRSKRNDLVFFQRKMKLYGEIPPLFRHVVEDLKLNENITDKRQRLCFHSLRHTFASWHAENGTNLYVIKELLGHGSIQLTERYSHLSKGTLQDATKNLEKSIAKKKKGEVIELNK